MKLKLNQSLRAALMACYAISAPIATTVTTGALITGAITLNLAPQAQANIYEWDGDAGDNFVHSDSNWTVPAGQEYTYSGWQGTWNSNATNVIEINSNTASGANDLNFQFDAVSLSGVIVTSDATDPGEAGYLVRPNKDRNLELCGTTNADTLINTDLKENKVNFLVGKDLSLGSSSQSWTTITMYAGFNIDVASAASFTIYGQTLALDAYDSTISGSGTTVINTNSLTGTGKMTVSAGSTLEINTLTAASLSVGNSIASAGTLSLGDGVSMIVDSTRSLDLAGKLVMGAGSAITINDMDNFTMDNDLVIDISTMDATQVGNSYKVQIFDTTEGVDLSTLWSSREFDFNNITGIDTSLAKITWNGDGSISYSFGAILTYDSTDAFTWAVDEGAFTDASGDTVTYFAEANLTIAQSSHATLGGDVYPVQLIINEDVTFTLTGGGTYKMNSNQVKFGENATLVLTDDVLGTSAVIGTGHVTSATVEFDATSAGTTFSYGEQMANFAGNVTLADTNLGTVTFDATSAGGNTLGFNSVTVNGGTLNMNAALSTGAISTTGGTANFTNDVTASTISLSGGSSTFSGAVDASSITVSNEGVSASFNGNVDLTGQIRVTNGSATFGETGTASTVTAGSLSFTGGTTTFNSDVTTGAVSVSATVTFNDTIASTGALTMGGSITLNGQNNTFTNIAFSNNNGKIALGENASLTFTNTSDQTTGNHVAISVADGSTVDFSMLVGIYGGSTWTITGDTVNSAGGTINFNKGLYLAHANGNTKTGNMSVGQYASVEVDEILSFGASGYAGNLTVNGNFASTASITVDGTSTSTITVNANESAPNGLVTLDQGLTATQTSGSTGTLNLNVYGTLALGNQANSTKDYSDVVTATLYDGSTLSDNGTVGGVSVETSLTYAANAAITFAGSSTGFLTMASDIDAATVTATVEGNVTFAGATSLATVTVAANANLTINGDYTFSGDNYTITNNGTLTLTENTNFDILSLLKTEMGTGYTLNLIGGNGTINMNGLSYTDIFSDDILAGLTDVSFENGVFTYSIAPQDIVISTGGSVDVGTGEVFGDLTYGNANTNLTINTADTAVKMTSNVSPISLTIGEAGAETGITATFSTDGEYVLNSTNIIINANRTLALTGDILGEHASFDGSAASSTIEFILGEGETVSYTDQLNGFTGGIAVSGSGTYVHTNNDIHTFTSITVNAGATFQFDEASWNIDGTNVTLIGGANADSTATFTASNSSIGADFSVSGHVTLGTGTNALYLYGDLVNTGENDVIYKTGSSELAFAGELAYTGDIDIQGGTVSLGGNSYTQLIGTVTETIGDISMASGTTLNVNVAAGITSLSSTDGGATLNASAALTVGNYTVTGSGITLNEGASMTSTSISNVALGASTLAVTASDVSVSGTSTMNGTNLTIATGSSLTLANTVEITNGGTVALSGTLTVNGNASFGDFSVAAANTSLVIGSGAIVDFDMPNEQTSGTSTWDKINNDVNITMNSGSKLTFDDTIWWCAGNVTVNAAPGSTTNAYVAVGGLFCGWTGTVSKTMTVDAGVTLESLGTITARDNQYAAFTVGTGGKMTVDVKGNLILNSGFSVFSSGTIDLDVSTGGSLQMNVGLIAGSNQDKTHILVDIASEASLLLGNQSNTTDYADYMTVTLASGATVAAVDTDEDSGYTKTAVYTTMTYAGDVTFDGGNNALIMNSAVASSNGTATIDGAVTFAKGATLSGLSINAESALTITGTNADNMSAVTAASMTNAGAVTVGAYGSLTLAADADYTGTLTLAGGALTVTDGTLDADISVTTAGSSLSASELNSTITLGTDISLALGGDVSFGTDFSINLGVTEWAIDDSYIIFTGAGATDVSGLGITDIVGSVASDDYTYTWKNTDGTISLEILAAIIEGDLVWNETDGTWEDANGNQSSGFDADSNLSFETSTDTESGMSGSNPTVTVDGAQESGNLTVDGTGTATLTGEADSSLTTSGVAVNDGATLVVGTALSTSAPEEGAEAGKVAVNNGTLKVTDSGSVDADITLGVAASGEEAGAEATTGKVAAGILTVEGTGASITGGVLNVDELAGGTVAKATVTVDASLVDGQADGVATLDGATIGANSTLEVKADSTLVLENGATVAADTSLADGASVKAGDITVTGQEGASSGVDYTDGSLTNNSLSNAVVSNATVTISAAATPVVSGFFARSANETVEGKTVITDTTFKNNSTIKLLSGADLTLTNVIIGADTTITNDNASSVSVEFTGTTGIEASTSTSTVAVDSTTSDTTTKLTISTLSALADSTVTFAADSSLNLSIELSSAAWTTFLAGLEAGDDFSFALASVAATNAATNITSASVEIYGGTGEDYAAYSYTGGTVSYDNGSILISGGEVIPEPSTTALSLMALAGLLARRRRRQA